MKALIRFALVATLALGANVASAIPLQINVTTAGLGGSQGSWSLVGTTAGADTWSHAILGSDTWNLDILAGEYDWSLQGNGAGILTGVTWSLRLAGELVDSGSAGTAFGKFRFNDDHSFTAVSVPEPATLALLGMGLTALGLVRRRRKI